MSGRFDVRGLLVGLLFIAAGTLFLLDRLGVLHLRADIIWPLAVIAVGAIVVLRALMRRG
jgi:hypothetical protein